MFKKAFSSLSTFSLLLEMLLMPLQAMAADMPSNYKMVGTYHGGNEVSGVIDKQTKLKAEALMDYCLKKKGKKAKKKCFEKVLSGKNYEIIKHKYKRKTVQIPIGGFDYSKSVHRKMPKSFLPIARACRKEFPEDRDIHTFHICLANSNLRLAQGIEKAVKSLDGKKRFKRFKSYPVKSTGIPSVNKVIFRSINSSALEACKSNTKCEANLKKLAKSLRSRGDKLWTLYWSLAVPSIVAGSIYRGVLKGNFPLGKKEGLRLADLYKNSGDSFAISPAGRGYAVWLPYEYVAGLDARSSKKTAKRKKGKKSKRKSNKGSGKKPWDKSQEKFSKNDKKTIKALGLPPELTRKIDTGDENRLFKGSNRGYVCSPQYRNMTINANERSYERTLPAERGPSSVSPSCKFTGKKLGFSTDDLFKDRATHRGPAQVSSNHNEGSQSLINEFYIDFGNFLGASLVTEYSLKLREEFNVDQICQNGSAKDISDLYSDIGSAVTSDLAAIDVDEKEISGCFMAGGRRSNALKAAPGQGLKANILASIKASCKGVQRLGAQCKISEKKKGKEQKNLDQHKVDARYSMLVRASRQLVLYDRQLAAFRRGKDFTWVESVPYSEIGNSKSYGFESRIYPKGVTAKDIKKLKSSRSGELRKKQEIRANNEMKALRKKYGLGKMDEIVADEDGTIYKNIYKRRKGKLETYDRKPTRVYLLGVKSAKRIKNKKATKKDRRKAKKAVEIYLSYQNALAQKRSLREADSVKIGVRRNTELKCEIPRGWAGMFEFKHLFATSVKSHKVAHDFVWGNGFDAEFDEKWSKKPMICADMFNIAQMCERSYLGGDTCKVGAKEKGIKLSHYEKIEELEKSYKDNGCKLNINKKGCAENYYELQSYRGTLRAFKTQKEIAKKKKELLDRYPELNTLIGEGPDWTAFPAKTAKQMFWFKDYGPYGYRAYHDIYKKLKLEKTYSKIFPTPKGKKAPKEIAGFPIQRCTSKSKSRYCKVKSTLKEESRNSRKHILEVVANNYCELDTTTDLVAKNVINDIITTNQTLVAGFISQDNRREKYESVMCAIEERARAEERNRGVYIGAFTASVAAASAVVGFMTMGAGFAIGGSVVGGAQVAAVGGQMTTLGLLAGADIALLAVDVYARRTKTQSDNVLYQGTVAACLTGYDPAFEEKLLGEMDFMMLAEIGMGSLIFVGYSADVVALGRTLGRIGKVARSVDGGLGAIPGTSNARLLEASKNLTAERAALPRFKRQSEYLKDVREGLYLVRTAGVDGEYANRLSYLQRRAFKKQRGGSNYEQMITKYRALGYSREAAQQAVLLETRSPVGRILGFLSDQDDTAKNLAKRKADRGTGSSSGSNSVMANKLRNAIFNSEEGGLPPGAKIVDDGTTREREGNFLTRLFGTSSDAKAKTGRLELTDAAKAELETPQIQGIMAKLWRKVQDGEILPEVIRKALCKCVGSCRIR